MSTLPPGSSNDAGWKKPLILAVVFLGTVLSVVANFAQLAVFPARVARAFLIAVVLTGLLYLVIKVWQLYYVEKVHELRLQLDGEAEKVTHLRSAYERCLEAIERISDRERPLFSETLEVTICIGIDNDSDLIIEKRVTTPEPLVTNRTMRPIIPVHGEQVASVDAISFTAHRDDGEITFIPLREQINKLKVWLVFDPPISKKTEWRVEYRPRGLWQPFRDRGFDGLGWDDRLQTTNGTPSAFTSFTAIFKFPARDQRPIVTERHGHGKVIKEVHNNDRTWEVTWRDDHPDGRRYDWEFA